MLSPQETVVKGAIDNGPIIFRVKTSQPGETIRVFSLTKLSEHDRSHLLECVGEITVKILGEMLTLAGLYRVAAEFDNLKILEVFHGFHPLGDLLGFGLGERKVAYNSEK